LYKGYALQLLRRYEEALNCYEQAILLDSSISAHSGRISALFHLHRYRQLWWAWKIALKRSSIE